MDPKADTVINDSDDSLGPATEELGFEVKQPANPDIGGIVPPFPQADELLPTTEPPPGRDLTKTSEAPPAEPDQVRDATEPDDETAGGSRSSAAGTLATGLAEAICRQFEGDLQNGKDPRIDDCIRDIAERERAALLSMLIAAELRFRLRAGERPTIEEYLNRYPADRALVDAVFLSAVGPKEIGPFRVIRFLGGGSFGRVYICQDPQLNRPVAIKLPRADRLTGPEGLSRFLREARHAALVQHPGIVTVHRVDFDDVVGCYVVMEYIEGRTLAALLRKKRLTPTRAAEMLIATAEAMSFAHEKGLVHRDIKPENILLDKQERPHIADFGLALHEDDGWPIRGEIAGTPAYMAPEQVRGESHRLDGRTDLWALGVILYRLLTGHRPFDGSCTEEIFEDILDREPVPPRQRDRTISKELERICLKCMSKRMADRYATASDFADDLRNWLTSGATDSPVDPTLTATAAPNDGKNPMLAESRSSDLEIVTPVRVRPKGLRAFDGDDRDFFLELLPGPRDREGLPESLRFWKVRIEPGKHERPFSVGLLCGPSGSGKTSMVKAGLLCRLSLDAVTPIYVEATPGATEARLKAALCRVARARSDELSLPEIVAGLRSGALKASGRKLLIVLDQFEQWLHAQQAAGAGDDELIRALRQCDGTHVQCLVLVRDDFAMAAARFMRALEIRLVESENFATVDPFDTVHARKVLRAFGVAYDRFKGDDEIGPHERFLDQATAELADDGKIAPVRLALFGQMIKDKPWTPATLRDVGGLQGIGVTFLDESLAGPAANPEHRLHLSAAREVLKALLPQGAADIKGHMRSYQELLVASGYVRRQGDFDTLMSILGTELRLITPTDPRGHELDDVEQPGPPAGRYYHLTHDYLVPSLREWINKNEKKTISGRTAIRLAERTAEWTARRSRRYLPSWWEWLAILLFTRRSRRSPAERRMLGAASLYHSARLAMVAAGAALVFMVASEWLGALNARAAVHGFESAEARSLPRLLENLKPYRRWADPLLRDTIADNTTEPRRKVRARLALLPVDAAQGGELLGPIIDVDQDDFLEIRDALCKYGDRTKLAEQCRIVLRNEQVSPERRLRAGMVLAGLLGPSSTSDDSVLSGAAVFLAGYLIDDLLAHPDRYNDWLAAMHPARSLLVLPLEAVFRDPNRPEDARVWAATILANYARENPDTLRELLLDSDVRQFPVIIYALSGFRAQANAELIHLVKQSPPAGWSNEQKSAFASRQANAAIGLLHWGDSDTLWPLLRHSPDPTLRTFLIDRLPRLAPDPVSFLNRLLQESEVSVRRALVLVLGGIPAEQRSASWAGAAAEMLLTLYETDSDAGIHSASEWALLQWNQRDRLRESTRRLVGTPKPNNMSWHVTPRGQTMATLSPEPFRMGAGEDERDSDRDEGPVARTVPRTFSIATKEVTAGEFLDFLPEFDRFPNEVCPKSDCSINVIAWDVAIVFCRRLSDREQITEDQMCYPPVEQIHNGARPYSDYLKRTGYRLPTEAELEYASRAGAVTSRYFGNDDKMLHRYAWFIKNSDGQTHPGGMLLPNDFGLFDVLGNVKEWCHDSYNEIIPSGRDREDPTPFDSNVERVARGGCYVDGAHVLRSANRYHTKADSMSLSMGFRVARTVSSQ